MADNPKKKQGMPRSTIVKKWDSRAAIAFLVIFGAFGLAVLQLFLGVDDGAHIPPWASGTLGSVITFYFLTGGKKKDK